MTDEEIDKIVKSQKFFQTQLFESDDEEDYIEPELADLSESRPESEVSTKTTKKKKTPKNDIIQSSGEYFYEQAFCIQEFFASSMAIASSSLTAIINSKFFGLAQFYR